MQQEEEAKAQAAASGNKTSHHVTKWKQETQQEMSRSSSRCSNSSTGSRQLVDIERDDDSCDSICSDIWKVYTEIGRCSRSAKKCQSGQRFVQVSAAPPMDDKSGRLTVAIFIESDRSAMRCAARPKNTWRRPLRRLLNRIVRVFKCEFYIQCRFSLSINWL